MALPSDIAQASPRLRTAYTRSVENMVGLFQAGVEAKGPLDAREAALALVALCVGGMVIARTTDDSALATEVREAARAFAGEVVAPLSRRTA